MFLRWLKLFFLKEIKLSEILAIRIISFRKKELTILKTFYCLIKLFGFVDTFLLIYDYF
jgi:hypothetical protein